MAGRLVRILFGIVFSLVAVSAWAQDAAALLKRASAAMGADDLRTLRFTAAGSGGQFGQAYRPDKPWPKINYVSYERLIDYRTPAMIETVVRSRAEPTGGGALPIAGEVRSGGAVSGEQAWNIAASGAATPRQAAREARLHDIWITPHGALMAAARNNAKLQFRSVGGRELAAVSFAEAGILAATVFITDGYLVERVESRVPDPVLGDTVVVTTYSDYRGFGGGFYFPTRIRQTMAGSQVLDLEVKEVQPNAKVEIAVPENVRTATERVVAEKAADGVWFLAGGSHNSVAIEMKDYVVLVEAPLYDGRAAAVIAETRKLAPGKPVRYVVNSHSHFDHTGGLRAAVAEGAAVITHQGNKAYYEKAFANPNRIAPDLLAKSARKAKVVGVPEKQVLSDGARSVEIHHLKDPLHTDTYLMVYLPKEKLLIEADAFTPAPQGSAAPAKPNPYHVNLVDNLRRLKLDVERILPLHGRMVPATDLYTAAGKQP